jgi:site-specific DNA-methyltransferase (adenine-specific)
MLLLGDCLEEMKKIESGSVDMVMCDLPYGTTQNKWDEIIPLNLLWIEYIRICKGAIVLTSQQPFTSKLVISNPSMFKYEWIWKKESGTGHLNAKKAPLKDHENILIFYKDQPTYNPQMRTGFKPYSCKQGAKKSENYGSQTGAFTVSDGSRYPLTTIEFSRDRNKVHPTQKPVALLEYLIRTYTNEGDTALDNTMGSGSTGVACANTGRKFIGIEKDPAYFAIAERRIAEAQSLAQAAE